VSVVSTRGWSETSSSHSTDRILSLYCNKIKNGGQVGVALMYNSRLQVGYSNGWLSIWIQW